MLAAKRRNPPSSSPKAMQSTLFSGTTPIASTNNQCMSMRCVPTKTDWNIGRMKKSSASLNAPLIVAKTIVGPLNHSLEPQPDGDR